jgi:DNA-binding transcriptional regulator YdaS (Cro superfamily)
MPIPALRDFRARHDPPLSLAAMARLIGVSAAAVSRWETGARRIDDCLVSKVERITGIPARKLRPDLAQLIE